MCFSHTVSLSAAAILIPAGAFALHRASKVDHRYLALCALPIFFGFQQFLEGMVWIAGAENDLAAVTRYSLAYMFFSWLAWPIWVPVSCLFLEPPRRKPLYLAFIIAGAILGGVQYVPYFAHDGWLVTRFLERAVSYEDRELLDAIIGREMTYSIYILIVILPLLISSAREARIFGLLVTLVLVVTYVFFRYAYVSVFCFGGAVMSGYLVWMIVTKPPRQSDRIPSGDALAPPRTCA
jgi:hypothetical protein